MGSDPSGYNFKHGCKCVSIHAPAWGATLPCAPSTLRHPFQSTLPRGERRYSNCTMVNCLVFQSTLPRGERRSARCLTNFRKVFQSTLPRGERLMAHQRARPSLTFQSTLPRGERHRFIFVGNGIDCFNPRSRVGSDKK